MNLQGAYKKTTQPFKELFFGSHFISLLVGHPYAISRTGLKQAIHALSSLTTPGPTLDVGCGVMPYRDIFEKHTPYEGIEIETRHKTNNKLALHFYDGNTFPLEDNYYSSVICFQVLEHCLDPELMLSECHRVLKEGGTLLLTMPLIWPEHEQPWDFQRFTYYGIKRHLNQCGFKAERIVKVNPGLACIIQISIDWMESFHRRACKQIGNKAARRAALLAWRIASALPYIAANLIGFFARSTNKKFNANTDFSNQELYLDLAVLARKIDH